MWPVVGIIVTAAAIAFIEAPRLARDSMYKELVVFAALLAVGLAVSVMNALRITLPNPLDAIGIVFKPIGKMLFGMLS